MKGNKYFSVILAYAIVLAVAVASMLLMFVVGAPEIVFILQIVGIVLNVVQIGLYIWHAVKSAHGEPATGIGRAILGVNLGWVALTALNFVLASFGAYLRWDLAVVWVCQLLTVLLVYKMWSKIEYKVALKNYAVTDSKNIKTGKTRYLVFVVIVLIIQIVSIALPVAIMSTSFRNEGLKYRNIMYESSEDGKEYYVKGIYWGASKSVFIPAEFNGRKVTKILDGAIDSETVWNKLFTSSKEVEKVIFEDTEEHPSNIREIGDRAIVGNSITEIALPSSIVSIGQEAVVSDNLKKVELYAQNGNVYFGTSIVTPVLETLSISATSDAVIVFEDAFQKEGLSVTIVNDNEDKSDTDKVQEKYNYIRENYPEIRDGLTVENIERKAIVNFETRLNGLFVPTKILDLVSGVAELRTSMLDELWTSTNAFIKNKTFFNDDLIFTDSVTGLRYLFRGWENELGKLVVFDTDTYSALFNKDTVLYARWAKVCDVTYNWGEYYVPVETSALQSEFVVGEEENNFTLPTFDRYDREGYRDLKWYCKDESDTAHYSLTENYLTSASFTDSVVLTPAWEMDFMQVAPALTYETGDDNLREELNSTSKVFTYDKENRLITTYSIHHPLNKTNYYTVNWAFEPSQYAAENGATPQDGSFELQYNSAARGNCVMANVRNLSTVFTCEYNNTTDAVCFTFVTTQVLESGTYYVVVTGQSANPEAVETVTAGSSNVTLSVEPKDLNLDKTDLNRIIGENGVIFPENNSIIYDGAGHSIFAQANPDAPIAFDNYNGNGGVAVGTYVVSVRMTVMAAAGSDRVNPNYLPATISSQYTISKTQVKVRWKMDNTGSSVGPFTTVYDGQAHTMVAVYGDDVPDSIRETPIALEGEITRTDCGTYSVRIANLSGDESYEYDFSDGAESVEWSITPRPVEITWQNTDVTYNGAQQMVTAAVQLCPRENESCVVAYKAGTYFAVKAGAYTAEVQSISNPNYTMEGGVGLTCDWTIKKLPVQVKWESVLTDSYTGGILHTTYNAQDQTIYAVAQNACYSDLTDSVDSIRFSYAGAVRGGILNANAVTFRNAGDYTMSIEGILGDAADNYTIEGLSVTDHANTAKSCDWTIDKKVLSKDWKEEKKVEYSADFVSGITYNGKKHTYVLEVSGFEGADVKSIVAGNFTMAVSEKPFALAGKYTEENNAVYTLELTVIDAGSYKMDVSMDLPNYVLNASTGTALRVLTVSPATVRFNWYVDEDCTEEYTTDFVYRGTNYQLYVKANEADLFANEVTVSKDTVKADLDDHVKKNAGDYTAKISKLDNGNYVVATASATKNWTIAKAILTITSNVNVQSVYSADVKTAYLYLSGFVSGEETAMPASDKATTNALALTTTTGSTSVGSCGEIGTYIIAMQAVNAGEYTMSLTALKSAYLSLIMDNYSLAAPKSVTLTIAPRVVALTWNVADHKSFEYNGNEQIVSAQVSNPQGTDVVSLTYAEGKGTKRRNVGEYVTEVSGIDNDPNYTIEGSTDLTRNWSVTKRTLTKSDSSWSGLENTYNAGEKKAVLTIGNVAKSDCVDSWKNRFTVEVSPSLGYSFAYDANANVATFTFAYTKAASFDITITCNDANYKDVSWTGTFSIAKKVLALTWVGADVVYDGEVHTGAYVAQPTNVENGDSITFSYSYSGGCRNVDTYNTTVIGFNGTGSANYTIEGTSDKVKTWNITKRTLSAFVWKNDSGATYESAYVYNGVERSVTATAGNAVEEVLFTYANNKATDASDTAYTAEITGIVGDDNNNNYALPAVTARRKDWKIDRAPIYVTDKTDGMTYTYNALTQLIKVFEFSGAVEDAIGASFTTNAGSLPVIITYDSAKKIYTVSANAKDAGNYTVSLNALFTDTNYRLAQGSSLTTSFTIAQKALNINWQDLNTTYIYSNEQKTFRVTVSGVEGGEEGVYTITGNKQTDAGEYTAEVTINNTKNYTFGTNNTTSRVWTIRKRVLSGYTWVLPDSTNYTLTYDRNVHTVSATASNAIGEVLFTYTANASSTNAGEYKTVITGIVGEANNKNYALPESEVALNWTILKAPLTVTWYDLNTSYTYNSQPQEYRVVVSGDIEGDTNVYTISGNVQTNAKVAPDTYTALVTINDTTNYAFADGMVASRDWTIAKAPLTITWTDKDTNYTYNRSAQTYRVIVDGVKGSDANVYTITGNVQTNAGTYSTFVTINNTNYRIDNGSVDAMSWTIKQKDINVAWTDYVAGTNYTYTSASQEYRITVTGDIEGDVNVYSVTGNVQTNAGNYTAIVAISDTNYKFADNTVTSRDWTIAKAPLTVTWTDKDTEYTYNGAEQEYHVTVEGVLGSDVGVYTITGNKQTAAKVAPDKYTATVTINDETNYTFASNTTTSRNWFIQPKTVSINNVDLGETVYDGSQKTFTLALDGIVASDLQAVRTNASISLPVNVTMSAPQQSITFDDNKLRIAFKVTNAGSYEGENDGKYTVVVNSLFGGNYSISGNGNVSFKVHKKAISKDQITLADGVNTFTYNGEEIMPQVLFDGITLTGATYAGTTRATIVGDYPMTLTGLVNANYMLNGTFTKDLSWSITKAPLTITWTDYDAGTAYTYNGAAQTYRISVSGVKGSDANVYTISGNVKTAAGSYSGANAAKVTLNDNTNYEFVSGTVTSRDWSIAKASLTITWTDYNAGTTYTYTGTAQTYHISVNGVKGSDANVYSVTGNVQTYADTYSAKVTLLDTTNYKYVSETVTERDWTIAKASLTITWTDKDTNYTYTGTEQIYRIDVSGVVNNETNVYSISGNKQTAAKVSPEKYTAMVTLNDIANYEFKSGTVTSKNWSIAKAPLTVTWTDYDANTVFTYNGTPQTYRIDVSGVVNNETNVYSITGNVQTVAGTYAGDNAAKVTLNKADNYEFKSGTAISRTWTIAKRVLTVSLPTTNTFAYDGTMKNYAVSVSNVADADANKSVYSVASNSATDAGDYNATVTINANFLANYAFTNTTDTTLSYNWKITPSVVTGVDFSVEDNAEFTYAQEGAVVTLSWKGGVKGSLTFKNKVTVIDNDTNSTVPEVVDDKANQATVSVSQLNAGEYTITVAAFNADNHTLATAQSITIRINKKVLTASVPAKNRYMDSTEIKYDGSGSGQTCGVSVKDKNNKSINNSNYSVSGNTAVTAGKHTATVRITNQNYTFVNNNVEVSEISLDWYIAKAILTVTSPETTRFTFAKGETKKYRPTVTGVPEADASESIYTIDGVTSATDVGTYTMAVTINQSWRDNYTFGGENSATYYRAYTWYIDPCIASLYVNGAPYNDETKEVELLYASTVSLPYAFYVGEELDNNVCFTPVDDTTKPTYTTTFTLKNNYCFTSASSEPVRVITVSWTIVPVQLTVAFDDLDLIYDDQGSSPTISITDQFGGVKNSDNVYYSTMCRVNVEGEEATYTIDSFSKTECGSYKLTVTVDDDYKKHYSIDGPNEATVHITPRPLFLQVTRTGYTYTGSEQTFDYKLYTEYYGEGNANNKAFNLSSLSSNELEITKGKDKVNAGTYNIELLWKDSNYCFVVSDKKTGVEVKNDSVNKATSTWTIAPKKLEETDIKAQYRLKLNNDTWTVWTDHQTGAMYEYNNEKNMEVRILCDGKTDVFAFGNKTTYPIELQNSAANIELCNGNKDLGYDFQYYIVTMSWTLNNSNYVLADDPTTTTISQTVYIRKAKLNISGLAGNTYSSIDEIKAAITEKESLRNCFDLHYINGNYESYLTDDLPEADSLTIVVNYNGSYFYDEYNNYRATIKWKVTE